MTREQTASPLPLSSPSPFGPLILGTTRLGDSEVDRAQRIAVARAAHEKGVWFHTSHRYGEALAVIREATAGSRAGPPRCIAKLGWNDPDEIADQLDAHVEALGVPRLDVGQLCLDGALAKDFASGGAGCEALARLRNDGAVGRFLLQVFPWSSGIALEALRRGHARDLVDGFIFYFNPLQRAASNALWDAIVETRTPFVAMRTLAGGDPAHLREGRGDTRAYLAERAGAVQPLVARSGARDWIEFAVRFSLSVPGVLATVASTASAARFERLMDMAGRTPPPLPNDIVRRLLVLQRHWADDHDALAVPGSL